MKIVFEGDGVDAVALECPALPFLRHLELTGGATMSYRFGLQELRQLETVRIDARWCDLLRVPLPQLRHMCLRSSRETLRHLSLVPSDHPLDHVEFDIHPNVNFSRVMRYLQTRPRIGTVTLHCSTDVQFGIPLPGVQRLFIFLGLPATSVDFEYMALRESHALERVEVRVDDTLLHGLSGVRLVGVPSVPEGLALFKDKHMQLGPGTMLEVCPDG
jgi:hypothetical protein